MSKLRFSIVINTLNRSSLLKQVLNSFRWLKYTGDFEIIVVNGPSTDDSDEVIASWLPHIRTRKCEVANLSVSRNIGICMARGDIIAFIDDDAIPEPEWLAQLSDAYSNPMVGAVGGFVYDHTGYKFQYKYCIVDRFGNADFSQRGPTPHLAFPKSFCFPHLLGCNSSFRRSALLEIGGFDEEYEYFLDETDVCLRIVDAGYIITQLPNAYVHHKYAPSHIRGEDKVVKNHYPIIKNKIYFMLKHCKDFFSMGRIMQEQQSFVQSQRDAVNYAYSQGLLTDGDIATFDVDLQRAIEVGLRRGIEGVSPEAMISDDKLDKYSGKFLPFSLSNNEKNKSILLISRDYPPAHGGGIAIYIKDLAESLGALGNVVHVITRSLDINRVDFEGGVWVHRVVDNYKEPTNWAIDNQIPSHIWNWSATALDEAKRISNHRKIDVVEAPIWDCEGIAFLEVGYWPLVTSLQTTLHFWLQMYPKLKADSRWMETIGSPLLCLEQLIMENSHYVRSCSRAIASEIENAYKFTFNQDKLFISPFGLSINENDILPQVSNCFEILFVGRLELRKGIDVLLEAIPKIIKDIPYANFRIIGEDNLLGTLGTNFKEKFYSDNADKIWLNQVCFEGKVDQDVLLSAFRRCDIFIAPSRFESFGLVYLEAMREGKPVIGCKVGGVPEIISNEVNGLLVEPENIQQLSDAIIKLATNDELRQRMGRASKIIFKKKFTAKRMAKESMKLYNLAEGSFLDLK